LAKFQEWWNRNIWTTSKSALTFDLKGTQAYSQIFGELDEYSNERVNERKAHQIATVYSCINVRAQTIAALPVNVIKEGKDGQKRVLTDHAAYYPLAHQPNSYMSSANMFMTSMIHSDSWGNSILAINRDGFNQPMSFEIIMPGDWDVKVVEGEAFYKIRA